MWREAPGSPDFPVDSEVAVQEEANEEGPTLTAGPRRYSSASAGSIENSLVAGATTFLLALWRVPGPRDRSEALR